MIHQANESVVSAYKADTLHASQGHLKQMMLGMDAFNHKKEELYYEEKTHFTIGSGVDNLLCFGKPYFDEHYYVSNIPKPSGKTQSIVKYVFDNANFDPEANVISLTEHRQLILDGCAIELFQPSWGDTAKINAIVRTGDPYFNDLVRSIDKIVLDVEEEQTIVRIANSFTEHTNTRIYFDPEYIPVGVEMYFQVALYTVINNVLCKVLIDLMAVDHVNKVIRPLDIKTTGDYTINFPKSAKRFRYDIQAAFYQTALDVVVKTGGTIAGTNPLGFDPTGYTVLPFAFIVESTIVQGNPLLFKCDLSFLDMGRKGRPEIPAPYNFPAIKGYEQLLKLYEWHQKHGYETDKDVYNSKGVFNLSAIDKYL